MRWLIAFILFGVVTYATTFVPLALGELAHWRLGEGLLRAPTALGPLLGLGCISTLLTARWLARPTASMRARFNLLGWCCGLQAAIAILALGLSTRADLVMLSCILGPTLGATLTLAPAIMRDGIAAGRRPDVAALAVALTCGVVHVRPLALGRPESLAALNAGLMAVCGWLAWTRQREIPSIAEPADGLVPPLALWTVALALLSVSLAYLTCRLTTEQPLRPLVWDRGAFLWLSLGAGGGLALVGRLRLRSARGFAALLLVAAAGVTAATLGIAAPRDSAMAKAGVAMLAPAVVAELLLVLAVRSLRTSTRWRCAVGWALAVVLWVGPGLGLALAAAIPPDSRLAVPTPAGGAALVAVCALVWIARTPPPSTALPPAPSRW